MGLASRRRYRWTRGRITDYWDEVFTPDGLDGHAAALDDQSAFIASLGSNRSARMRDVLGTIQADQDAIIRAGSRGALVVDGGPGTGKTVVALHRDRLPALLRPAARSPPRAACCSSVRTSPTWPTSPTSCPASARRACRPAPCATSSPRAPRPGPRPTRRWPRLKSSADVVEAIETAVRFYEEPPAEGMTVETPWAEVWLTAGRLGRGVRGAGARHAAQRGARPGLGGAAHDPGRQARRGRLARAAPPVAGRGTGTCSPPSTGPGRCSRRPTSSATCGRCPPTCAGARPGSAPTRSRRLQREDPQAWTVSDLPLLDAARQRLGDPEASRRKRRHDAAVAAEREHMTRVVDDLIEADDSELLVMSMLRGEDLRRRPGRRGRTARRRPGPARRPVRARRRGRGPGADRRRVADAAAPLPVPELHHRRGPGPGPARVHRVVAGTARAGRARPDRPWPR